MKMHEWFAAGLVTLLMASPAARAGSIFSLDLTTGGTASAFPNRTPGTEGPANAFDDTRNKGLIFNDVANDNTSPYEDVTAANPVIWTYVFTGPVTVRSYSLTSANDSPGRDPRDFFLEGSNDGNAWTTVDTVANHAFQDQPTVGDDTGVPAGQPANRFETYFFQVDNPAQFSQMRLRVVETFGTADDRPQIADIQMFPTDIPEPGSLGLLALAAMGMLRRARR